MEIKWRFPSNDYGENKGINDSGVAMFRGTPLKSLAREICQNSLDASIDNKTIVEFNMFKVPTENIPGRDILCDTFNRCLDFWEGQKVKATKEFFEVAAKKINENTCSFLRISDFNTTGLTGSRKEINTNWTNLTKSSGASDKKGTAGGSYGIGKFAPFACSDFSTVFYSTYDINEEKAYQGVTRLVTFTRADGENTQGIGYFGNPKNTPVYEELHIDPYFERKEKEYGTDIYIAGYKYDEENWEKDIVISILDGFLGAIWNEKLEVRVGEIIINKQKLGDVINIYCDELTGYTDKYYNVLISKDTVWYEEDFLGMGEIKLGLLLGGTDYPSKVSMIRQTGMKIMDKDRLSGYVPFTGVMFLNGQELNKSLRLIENPEHTKWEPDRSKNPIKARQLLKEINSYIKSKINKLVSMDSEEAIDAIGVGNYIPDEITKSNETKKDEVVNDRVKSVEIKKVVKKRSKKDNNDSSIIKSKRGSAIDRKGNEHVIEQSDEDVEGKGDGNDGAQGGTGRKNKYPINRKIPRDEEDITKSNKSAITVGIEKIVCICIDKNKGKYMLKVVPNKNGINGIIELYLSAETNKYEARLKSVSLIGGNAFFNNNIISGLTFVKGKEMRFSLEIDYYDYCSMEVMMYAIKK